MTVYEPLHSLVSKEVAIDIIILDSFLSNALMMLLLMAQRTQKTINETQKKESFIAVFFERCTDAISDDYSLLKSK